MNFAELFSMDARAFYIWGSFGAFAVVLACEVILLRARLKRVAAKLGDEQLAASTRSSKVMGK